MAAKEVSVMTTAFLLGLFNESLGFKNSLSLDCEKSELLINKIMAIW